MAAFRMEISLSYIPLYILSGLVLISQCICQLKRPNQILSKQYVERHYFETT